MQEKHGKRVNEEYAHEFGIQHSVQESDAKVDLTKYLLSKKEMEKRNEKEKKTRK